VGVQRSRTFTHRWKRFPRSGSPFCSEPRAELRLEDRGGVGPAHHSQVVQQIRYRRRFPVPRLPQVQNVLGWAGFGREIIDVPVTRTEHIGCVIWESW